MSQSQTEPAPAARVERFTRFERFVTAGLIAAALAGLAHPRRGIAQAPPPRTAPASPPAGEPRRLADLTTRYRLSERYATQEDPSNPQAIVQARVGIVETVKTVTDNPRGAPETVQVVARTIYTERPAELGPDGTVLAAVRRFDAFRLSPDAGAKPTEARPLEGLMVWYQLQPAVEPLVLCLTENRRLREIEYSIIGRQLFLPALGGVLPTIPSRIGDRWRVSPAAVRSLLGGRAPADVAMLATFKDLRVAAKGPDHVATLEITSDSIRYHGAIQFSFPPPAAPVDDSGGSTVDARGAIIEIRSALVVTTPLPDSNGRLRQTQTRELILARQREAAALVVPEPKPTPTEANSWLTYVDPRRRFYLQHPQSLIDDTPPGAVWVELARLRPEGRDEIRIQLQPKTGDAEADRRNVDPEFHKKTLEEIWRQEQQDVIPGSSGWLPEAEWKPLGLRVYRIEAAMRIASGRGVQVARRVHLDSYLVLTNRPDSLVVSATTLQEPPLDFRKETETLIKTFRFGPPEK